MNNHFKKRFWKKKKTVWGLGVMVLALTFPANVMAVGFQIGDIFAGVGNFAIGGKIEHYDKDLNFIELLDTGISGLGINQAGMAFDKNNNLYATNFDVFGLLDGTPPPKNSITRFNGTGALTLPNPFASADPGSGAESIVFDNAGNFYVGQQGGFIPGNTRNVIKFDKDGNRKMSFTVETESSGSDAIDLAADQETLFYTSERRTIKRYNVRTDMQLSDFATLPGPGKAAHLRKLDDGGVLVADGLNIKRLDKDGNVIQEYDVMGQDSWFALNLDPDGTSFWSGDALTNTFCKFDIASAMVLNCRGIETPGGTLRGLTIFGELTQAILPPPNPPAPPPVILPPPPPNPVPEPATVLLLGTGIATLIGWRFTNGNRKSLTG